MCRIFAFRNNDNDFGAAKQQIGAVVQLVRISACHAGGRGFESRPHRRKASQKCEAFFVVPGVTGHNYAGMWDQWKERGKTGHLP